MRIDSKQTPSLWRQLSSLLAADVDLAQALGALAADAESERTRTVCEHLQREVADGKPLSAALLEIDGIDDASIAVVSSGEQCGDLTSALRILAEYSERSRLLGMRGRMALIYPTLVLVFCFIASVALYGINDRVIDELLAMGGPVTAPSFLLRQGAFFVVNVAFGLGAILLALIWATRRFPRRMVRVGYLLDALAMRIPLWGRYRRTVASARFFRVLATLLRAELPLDSALEFAGRASGNESILRAGEAAGRAVREGRKAGDVLAASSLTSAAIQAFRVAEGRGDLAETTDELAHYFDETAAVGGATLIAVAEPLAIACIGLVAATLIFAIALPSVTYYSAVP